MKILVIGGSYFLGRVFVMQAAGVHEITLVNRGTYSMEEWGVRQIRGDRRDKALWQGILMSLWISVPTRKGISPGCCTISGPMQGSIF